MAAAETMTGDQPSAPFLALEGLFPALRATNAEWRAPVDDGIRAGLARSRPAGATR